MIPGEPELIAKNCPADKPISNFLRMKRLAHWCYRCNEPFITDIPTQHYCPTCRGGDMGRDQARRFLQNWNHGIPVRTILEDMRR